jgi:FG-GAP repeat
MLVGSPAEGMVYLYLSTGTAFGTMPMQTFSGSPAEQYGRALLGGMDFDADHHADIVIGAPRAAAGDGAAYVLRGAGDGSLSEARTIRGMVGVQNATGSSLAVVGDVYWGRAQSAGCATVLAGAPGNIALSDPGRVFAVHGDPIVGFDDMPMQREINATAGELAFGAGVGGARAH